MIELKNISFSYSKEKQIFNNLNLSVNDGECVGIVGSNGSGKSTLLKIMTGVLCPSCGTVEIQGKNFWRRRMFRKPAVIEEHASLIGYVMQKPERQLFAQTVFDDVAFGPRNLGFSNDKVEESVNTWLEYFEIESLKDKSPYKISGGQQRMVAIAGVLAMEQPNVCFDEPSASLDEDAIKKIHNVILDLRKKGKTVVLVSHDAKEVELLCDFVFEIEKK